MKPADFIAKIAPFALTDRKVSGVPASLTIAQAILESAWGESGLTKLGNNLFGIKAKAGESFGVYKTIEFVKGAATSVEAKFAHYSDWGACLSAHSNLLRKKRYAAVLAAKSYKEAVKAVYVAGYATDPQYPMKLQQLIERYQLWKYDQEGEEYMLQVEDANELIKTYLQPAYAAAKTGEQRNKIARQADELRKASGQEPQNS